VLNTKIRNEYDVSRQKSSTYRSPEAGLPLPCRIIN
jgi:hypothetical protein